MSQNLIFESDIDFQTKKTNSPPNLLTFLIIQKWKDEGDASCQMLTEQLNLHRAHVGLCLFLCDYLVHNRKVETWEHIRSCHPSKKLYNSSLEIPTTLTWNGSIMSYNLLDESDIDFRTKKTNSPESAYILSILQKWKDQGHTSWQVLIEPLNLHQTHVGLCLFFGTNW